MTRRTRCEMKGLWFLIATMSLATAGCSAVTSRAEVIGKYQLNVKNGAISLDVSEDGHFSETIVWPSGGRRETLAGSWYLEQNVLNFDRLWIPREFAPDYIQEADDFAKGQPKYTAPLHWMVKPEKQWGRVILTIFPDNDEYFKMTK
jgi:hypothetical protein